MAEWRAPNRTHAAVYLRHAFCTATACNEKCWTGVDSRLDARACHSNSLGHNTFCTLHTEYIFAGQDLNLSNLSLTHAEVKWWEFVLATGIWNIATSSLWSLLGGSASSLLQATRAREVLSTYRANAMAGAMRHPIYFVLLLFILVVIVAYLLRSVIGPTREDAPRYDLSPSHSLAH